MEFLAIGCQPNYFAAMSRCQQMCYVLSESADLCFYPANDTPINFPIPNVIAAAKSPNITCRNPEYQMLLPVNNVIAHPIINSPAALHATLITIAIIPFTKKNGNTGIIAPAAKRINE